MTNDEIINLIKIKKEQVNQLLAEISALQVKYNSNNLKQFTTEEKINIFMNYFKGRDDVY